MDSSEVLPKTYTLLFYCPCFYGCMKKLKKVNGVVVLKVDEYKNEVTISATGNIKTIISELKSKIVQFNKLLPDEESQPMDEPAELQIVPVNIPVQKVVEYEKPEFIGVIVRAPKLIAEKAYDSYSKHEHDFELITHDKRFSCDVCREDGCGSRYKCYGGDCNHELHEECNNPKPTVTHDLFDKSTFELSDLPYNADPCNACGRRVCGRFYHCKRTGLNLHPRCANLKAKIYGSGKCFVLQRKASNDCFWCGKKEVPGVKSWSYVSSEDDKCCFHVRCVTKMVQEAWKMSGVRHTDDVSMALATIGAHNKAVSKKKNKGNLSGFMKIASILLKVVIAILLGDPTALLISTIVELLK